MLSQVGNEEELLNESGLHLKEMHQKIPSIFKPVSIWLEDSTQTVLGLSLVGVLPIARRQHSKVLFKFYLSKSLLCLGRRAAALKLLTFLLPSFSSPVSSAQVSLYQNLWHTQPQHFFSFDTFSSKFERQFPNCLYWEVSSPIFPYQWSQHAIFPSLSCHLEQDNNPS